MTIEIEQQLTKKKINGKEIWVVSTPKSVSGYRTIPVGIAIMNILRRAKMQHKEN